MRGDELKLARAASGREDGGDRVSGGVVVGIPTYVLRTCRLLVLPLSGSSFWARFRVRLFWKIAGAVGLFC